MAGSKRFLKRRADAADGSIAAWILVGLESNFV